MTEYFASGGFLHPARRPSALAALVLLPVVVLAVAGVARAAARGAARSGDECVRAAVYREALSDRQARQDVGLYALRRLRRVPPVAWIDGYWVTPVDLLAGLEQAPLEAIEARPGLPEIALALTPDSLRETVALPDVGAPEALTNVEPSRPGLLVVPAADPGGALIEYLPPPGEGQEAECYFFCGDPAGWDFDGDGRPNAEDTDDDGDGTVDEQDRYPYWPAASDCACGDHAFVGFTGKFSEAVTAAVLAAYETSARPHEPIPLGTAGPDDAALWLVLPRAEDCATGTPDCPDAADPGVRWVSRDPADCARLRFFCDAGLAPFSNDCGCGCAQPGRAARGAPAKEER